MSRLSQLRHERGLTQQYVSKKCEVNVVAYRSYEKCTDGLSNAKGKVIYRLAKFFDVSMEYILGYSDKRY